MKATKFYNGRGTVFVYCVTNDGFIIQLDFENNCFAIMPEQNCLVRWSRNAKEISRNTFKKYERDFQRNNPYFKLENYE